MFVTQPAHSWLPHIPHSDVFCHSNSAQRWVTPLCQLGNLHARTHFQAQINKSQGCVIFFLTNFKEEDINRRALLSG